MTTAGFLSSWTTNKALYFTHQDSSYNRVYGRVVARDTQSAYSIVSPYAKLGTAAYYGGYIQPHQLKIYMVSNDAPSSTQKLNWIKQGQATPSLLLGGTSGLDISDGHLWKTPFGIFIKYLGGNLYRVNEQGVLEQTITPADLGGSGATAGSTNDYLSYPTTVGTHATDFAFISVGGQVCIYRPTSSPGAQPERISIVGGSPNSSSYNANGLCFSHRWGRLFWVADTSASGTQMFYLVPANSVVKATTPVAPNNYANCITIHNGDPIFIGQDDKVYRSTDGGATYSLWLNTDILCNAFAFRYLASDGRNIFLNGIDNVNSNSMLYQIDVNLAVQSYPTINGWADYDPNMLQVGYIV